MNYTTDNPYEINGMAALTIALEFTVNIEIFTPIANLWNIIIIMIAIKDFKQRSSCLRVMQYINFWLKLRER